jgi:hypothetical protein
MKSIKLATALAVATTLTTGAFAADSLAGALSEGKVSGHLKSHYFMKTNKDYNSTNQADAVKSNIWVQGADLTYKTGSWGGLSAVLTGQFAVVTSKSNDSTYNGDMDGSGFVLSQAYLKYTIKGKGSITAGRQYIKTPIVKGSGSRIIKQSVNGVVAVVTAVPNNVIVGAHVSEYQNRTDENGAVGEFDDTLGGLNASGKGVSTIYLKNTSIPNLIVQAQVASLVDTDNNTSTNDTASLSYYDAKYKFGPAYAAAQFVNTAENGGHLNHLAGIKVGGKFGPVNAYVAYSQTGNTDANNSVHSGLGSSAARSNFTANTLESTGSAYRDNSTALAVHAGVNMKALGLKAFVRYTQVDSEGDATANDLNDIDIMVAYNVTKNLNVRVDHAILDWGDRTGATKNNGDADDTVRNDTRSRLKATYKF